MPSARSRRRVVGLFAASVVATMVGTLAACAPDREPAPAPSSSSSPTATLPSPVEKTKSFFNMHLYSIDDPTSIWVVNDKLRPLNPIDYVPPDLVTPNVPYVSSPLMRQEAATALEAMVAAAKQEGAGQIQIQNAYRSYDLQVRVHQYWVDKLGKIEGQKESARPGYSEHQTGLTFDAAALPEDCTDSICFGTTPQGKWLASQGWRFGWVVRYPDGYTPITGYNYEPWHMRYVGVALATELHVKGVATLEEFFGLPAAPEYPND